MIVSRRTFVGGTTAAAIMAFTSSNTEAKKYTIDWFNKNGYEVFDSQTNFIFAKINRPAADLRDGCRRQGISVGRDFRPMEKTHARISIGTMDEMQRACAVFQEVLA